MHGYTNTQIHTDTDAQIHKYTNTILIHTYSNYTNTQIHRLQNGIMRNSKWDWGRRRCGGSVDPDSTQNLAFCKDKMFTSQTAIVLFVKSFQERVLENKTNKQSENA